MSTKDKVISILIIGKTGVGKSTLANAMVGEEIFETGAGPRPRTINCITRHKQEFEGITLNFYDTRGLCDGMEEIEDEDILHEIQKAKPPGHFDIVLLCTKLQDRFELQTRQILRLLHKFDSTIWSKVFIALTNADHKPGSVSESQIDEKMNTTVEEWKEDIAAYLKSKLSVHQKLSFCATTAEGMEGDVSLLQNWLAKFILTIAVESAKRGSKNGMYLALACSKTSEAIKKAIKKVTGKSLNTIEDVRKTIDQIQKEDKLDEVKQLALNPDAVPLNNPDAVPLNPDAVPDAVQLNPDAVPDTSSSTAKGKAAAVIGVTAVAGTVGIVAGVATAPISVPVAIGVGIGVGIGTAITGLTGWAIHKYRN